MRDGVVDKARSFHWNSAWLFAAAATRTLALLLASVLGDLEKRKQ